MLICWSIKKLRNNFVLFQFHVVNLVNNEQFLSPERGKKIRLW